VLPIVVAAAAAAPSWGVTPFEAPEALDEDVGTLRLLLVTELEERGVVVDPDSAELGPCGESDCASEAAGKLGVDRVVAGTVRPFGQKLLVSTLLVDAAGRSESRRIVIDRVEDFDVAAKRVASAFLEGRPTDRTAKLGEITALETERTRRKRGFGGLSLGLGAVLPLEGTYAGNAAGVAFRLGYWFEARRFALETALGFRFTSDPGGDRRFFDVPLTIGGYYIAGLGDFAPFFGGGLGIRYLYEARPGTIQVGNVVVTQHQGELSDDGFGATAFARAGVMILRTYEVRASVSLAYEAGFVDLSDRGFPQTLLALVSVHF